LSKINSTTESHEDILSRIRKGDRGAFNLFCKERFPSLIAYARLFLSDYWADDVVQDVFFGVWQNRAKLENDGSDLQSYLIRSVYNRCMNYLKKVKLSQDYRTDYEKQIATLVEGFYSPDNNPVMLGIFNADLRNIIEQAISSLSPRCQEVFRMSYIDDMSDKEIAEKLGISLSTVENHMYTALKQLRLKLNGV
jgi:RNA polymerase sigma-70 factor (ECF subfamily)